MGCFEIPTSSNSRGRKAAFRGIIGNQVALFGIWAWPTSECRRTGEASSMSGPSAPRPSPKPPN